MDFAGGYLRWLDVFPALVVDFVGVKVLEVKIAPGIDFIQSRSDGLGIADIYHLYWVAFLPALLIEWDVVLNPGVVGVDVAEIGEYLKVE